MIASTSDDGISGHRTLRWTSVFGLLLKGGAVMVAVLSQVVFARCMALDEYGTYVTIFAWVTVLSLLGGAGMPLAAVRYLPVYRDRADWAQFRSFIRSAWWLCLSTSLVIAAGFIAAIYALPSLRPQLPAAVAGAPLVLLLCLASLATGILQAVRRPLFAEIIANLLRSFLVVVLIGATAVLFGPLGAPLAIGLTCLAGVLALLPAWRAVLRAAPVGTAAAHPTDLRRTWIVSSLAFVISMAAMSLIERLDTIMLGALAGPSEAGLYSVASRLALMVGFAVASVNALLGPMAAELIGRKDLSGLQRTLANGVLLATGLGVGITVVLLVLGSLLLRVFGPSFPEAAPALQILACAQLLQAVMGSAGGMLAIAGHNRILVGIMLAAVAVDLLLCLLLIPGLGQIGAALATTGALATSSIGLMIAARRLLHVDTSLRAGVLLLARSRDAT